MVTVEASSAADEPWLTVEPVRIGDVPATPVLPNLYYLVRQDESPLMRVDFYAPADESSPFEAHHVWNDWVVLGLGCRVYMLHSKSQEVRQLILGSYFGYLWPDPEFLLVASAQHVFRVNALGDVLWRSPVVGVDGVVFKSVTVDFVTGKVEWDPPGRWRAFRLSTKSGEAA